MNRNCPTCGKVLLVCNGDLMCVIRTCPDYAKPVKS